MRWIWLITGLLGALVAGFMFLASNTLSAQQPRGFATSGDARDALRRAEADLSNASKRAEVLEQQVDAADEAASKAARESAALAARVQQSEAQITATEARLALIQDQQAELDLQLAEKREPLMRLTAALQRLSRRPLTLSALRSGSLRDTVYLRAMLATTLPQVEERTVDLRAELARSRELAQQATAGLAQLHDTEEALAQRRQALALLEAGQRQASRDASLAARRETERVFALAEEARDLDTLIGELDRSGRLREQLAALHGPVLRPPRPGQSEVVAATNSRLAATTSDAPSLYRLPVTGRVTSGFGSTRDGAGRSRGIELAPRDGAVVVAPASGRIAFAGPYRGYGRIVIVEHPGGWTSLITGLARNDAAVGEEVVAGAPLGIAPTRNPRIVLELTQRGNPRNPLDFVG